MDFKESLSYLNLEDYGERIFNSNTRGELSHIQGYIDLAKYYKENKEALNIKNARDMLIEYLKVANTDIVMQYFPIFAKETAKYEVYAFKVLKDFGFIK